MLQFLRSKWNRSYCRGDEVKIRSTVKQQPASHRETAEINSDDILILLGEDLQPCQSIILIHDSIVATRRSDQKSFNLISLIFHSMKRFTSILTEILQINNLICCCLLAQGLWKLNWGSKDPLIWSKGEIKPSHNHFKLSENTAAIWRTVRTCLYVYR